MAALVILMAFFAAPVRDVFADAGEFSGNSDYDFSGGADYDSGGDSFGGDWAVTGTTAAGSSLTAEEVPLRAVPHPEMPQIREN